MFSVHIIIIHRYVFRKYYTDWQDVDEDARTIADHGGSWGFGWSSGDTPGVFLRNMTNSSAISGNTVASKNNAQPPILLGGYVMYCITTSPCQSFYGFQWLNIKTIFGLYIAYYTHAPLLPEGEVQIFLRCIDHNEYLISNIDKLKPRGCVADIPTFEDT